MSKQIVLTDHVQSIGLSNNSLRYIKRELQLEKIGAVLISDLVEHFGDLPVIEEGGRRVVLSAPPPIVRRLMYELVSLGLTPTDWPLLGGDVEGILNAHIEKAGKDKEKIKKLSILTLRMSSFLLEELRERFWVEGRPGLRNILIADLLVISPWKLLKYNKPNVRQSMKKAREKLRSLGFTNEDGEFLREGNKEEVFGKISRDLTITIEQAEKAWEY